MIRAYFLDASRESSSDLAPVTTILPDANIRAVVLGSLIRITTAAKRCLLVAVTCRRGGECEAEGVGDGGKSGASGEGDGHGRCER